MPIDSPSTDPRTIVLVGGGHAHVQVLRRFAMKPEPGARLVVILDRAEAIYSGMVPGFVAGDYTLDELSIDVVPLARRAGASVILAGARSIDPKGKTITLPGRPPIRYDIASLDVGSTVRGLDVPGVLEHALTTRPIRSFVDLVDRRIEDLGREPRLVVVGGGAAGVELCFTLKARLEQAGRRPRTTLLTAETAILAEYPDNVRERLLHLAREKDIQIETDRSVVGVDETKVMTVKDPVPSDLTVWATGAAPIPFLNASALPKNDEGFVRCESTLQVEGAPNLFAVGDCAHLKDAPWVPKAGVYAVRQGPFLADNLRASLRGRSLRSYKPQRDFLSLLHLGDKRALGAKWGKLSEGRAVLRLKDRIDRRFMNKFQVLDASGMPTKALPSPEAMGMDEMECGGCAAKLGGDALERALGRLPEAPADERVIVGVGDDAAVVDNGRGDATLLTVDAFRAFCDDPWLVGRVAAVNAVSDIYACGGTPRHALAWVQVPERGGSKAEETLFQALSGVRAALDPLHVSVVGGHTTHGDELVVGLTITGEPGDGRVLAKGGAQPGDQLILTKPLGTGVLLAADMRGLATGAWLAATTASMLRDNRDAAECARSFGATASTDISGFGLAVHLAEMLSAGNVAAHLSAGRLSYLPGAKALLERGERSTFHPQNEGRARTLGGALVGAPPILFDPQTSGGLLLCIPAAQSDACLAALQRGGDREAAWIGEIRARNAGDDRLSVE